MSVQAAGQVLDKVERSFPIGAPGVDVHPLVFGAFRKREQVALALPAAAQFPHDGELVITLGEHVWPELGERLEYLLRYPHGCVEQTTSSTLPLVAAREIFPRIGITRYEEAFFRERIVAGINRLASMRTSSGGLAYWPGDSEPSTYGTAYAMRAVLAAKAAGYALPAGLLEGMRRYLVDELAEGEQSAETRASIAESLATLGALPPGRADSLFSMREGASVFTSASLALALSSDELQRDRVAKLLDDVEAAFDSEGRNNGESRYGVFGSDARSRARAAAALTRLRPQSELLPKLIRRIAEEPEPYTTQSTAYGLLALRDHLVRLPARGTDVSVELDGEAVAVAAELPGGGRELRIRLSELAGKKRRLTLAASGEAAVGFSLRASYSLPLTNTAGSQLLSQSAQLGPDVYRVLSTPAGEPLDPSRIEAGSSVPGRVPGQHPDALQTRVGVVEQGSLRRGRHRVRGERKRQHQQQRRRAETAARSHHAEAEGGESGDQRHARQQQEGRAQAEGGQPPERGQQHAEHTPQRAQGVQDAGVDARRGPRPQGEAQGGGRDAGEQHAGESEEGQHPAEPQRIRRAREPHAVHQRGKPGRRGEPQHGAQQASEQQGAQRQPGPGLPVREHATERVAHRERGDHRGDHRRPDRERGAEVRRQQAAERHLEPGHHEAGRQRRQPQHQAQGQPRGSLRLYRRGLGAAHAHPFGLRPGEVERIFRLPSERRRKAGFPWEPSQRP